VEKQSRKFVFTDRKIERLSVDLLCERKQLEFADERNTGLRVMLYKSGKKTFIARYNYLGKRFSIGLGEFPAFDVNTIRNMFHQFVRDIRSGLDPAFERKRKGLTFQQFCETIYIPYAKLEKRSWKADVSKLDNYLYEHFGAKQLDSITRWEIDEYRRNLKATHAVATCNKHLALIKSIYRVAIESEMVSHSPASLLKQYRENNQIENFLSTPQIHTFLRAVKQVENREAGKLLEFLLYSGLRVGEACSLEFSQYNRVAETINLPTTKNGRSRQVILNTAANDIILEQLKLHGTGYIFKGRDGIQQMSRPTKVFQKVKALAGLDDHFRIHDLRHSFASIAVMSGSTPSQVQALLGHASSRTTERYMHLAPSHIHEAASNVGDFIARAYDGADN